MTTAPRNRCLIVLVDTPKDYTTKLSILPKIKNNFSFKSSARVEHGILQSKSFHWLIDHVI